MTILNKEQ